MPDPAPLPVTADLDVATGPAPESGSVDRRLALIQQKLVEQWEVAPFPRLAETPADNGHPDHAIDNPYWQFLRLMPRAGLEPQDQWAVAFSASVRDLLVRTYASSIPSPADIRWIVDLLAGRDLLEVGAGSGYWAWQLRQAGIDVIAVDNRSTRWDHMWTDVDYGNTADASLHADRALMLIHPPHESSMAQTALDFYDGDLLVFAGDETTAASRIFHATLARGWEEIAAAAHHPTYVGIPCRLRAFRRRSPR
ncbi:hypothetical protein [Nocardia sp. NPDC005366]|uniref:hypothetical protein n=1 Tax=Nocardia sp. NPDC005366 TaxID=3156878 RepID=UPI0033B8A7DB